MPRSAAKARNTPRKTLFHAAMQVTRLEEWCVEAETAEDAKALLESGEGHRCQLGDLLHFEVQQILD